MMTCQQITQTVSDFLERRLRLRDRLAFLLHIAMCKGCRAYVEQFRLSLVGLRSLGRLESPAVPPEELMDRLREEIRRKGSK